MTNFKAYDRIDKLTSSIRFSDMVQNINERILPKNADGLPYIGLEHLDPESLKIRRWGTPDEVEAQKLRFYAGDIIFGKRRYYQKKLAVADFDGMCSAHAMVLRAKSDVVLPEFLPFFMQSEMFFERAMAISVGSLSPTINWSTLAKQEFPLPPLDEQRHIAQMMWAVEDVLEHWLNATLNSNIAIEAFINSVSNSDSLGYKVVSLEEVAEIIMGQSPPGNTYNLDGIGALLLNGPTEFGDVYPTAVQWTTQPTKFAQKGDILFCVRGSTTGRQNIADQEYCIGRGLAAIRGFDGQADTMYLKIILEALTKLIFREAKGSGSTFPNITSKRLGLIHFPLPPIDKQLQLVKQFSALKNLEFNLGSHIQKLSEMKFQLLNNEFLHHV